MLLQLALLTAVHVTHADSVRARPSATAAATPAPAAPARAVSARANRTSAIGIADSLVLNKAEHRLTLYSQGRPLRSYLVALGRNPPGAKPRRGDGRPREGLSRINTHNAWSQYPLSLHISYPNATDLERAR